MAIMVVDDDRDTAETMAMLLALDGAYTVPCLSGEAALQLLSQRTWHAVLLDIGMPCMDGAEAAQILRDSPLGAHILLIALTGHAQATIEERVAEADFDYVFKKPADPEILCQKLATFWAARSFQ
jgi:CheY-like chemotaxis protein